MAGVNISVFVKVRPSKEGMTYNNGKFLVPSRLCRNHRAYCSSFHSAKFG
jgi:hypothetical protein